MYDYLHRLQSPDPTQNPIARAAQTLSALTSTAAATARLTDVVFNLDASTTATLTRAHLPGSTDDIVNNTKPHGVLPRQLVGTFVTVVIQVAGTPNTIGVVNVQNATPATFQLRVSDGPVGTKPLLITGSSK